MRLSLPADDRFGVIGRPDVTHWWWDSELAEVDKSDADRATKNPHWKWLPFMQLQLRDNPSVPQGPARPRHARLVHVSVPPTGKSRVFLLNLDPPKHAPVQCGELRAVRWSSRHQLLPNEAMDLLFYRYVSPSAAPYDRCGVYGGMELEEELEGECLPRTLPDRRGAVELAFSASYAAVCLGLREEAPAALADYIPDFRDLYTFTLLRALASARCGVDLDVSRWGSKFPFEPAVWLSAWEHCGDLPDLFYSSAVPRYWHEVRKMQDLINALPVRFDRDVEAVLWALDHADEWRRSIQTPEEHEDKTP